MPWWSLFRDTVVPVVQAAVSNNQPTTAPDTPLEQEEGDVRRSTLAGTPGGVGANIPVPGIFGEGSAPAPSAPAPYTPSGFAQQFEAFQPIEQALAEGQALPPEVRAQLVNLLPEWGYEGISWEPDSSPPVVLREDYLNRSDQEIYDAVRGNIEGRMNQSEPFGGILGDLAKFDFTGIMPLALGDTTPGGLLGLQFDLGGELLGVKPEELAGITRAGAMMLNPYVALGGSLAPTFAYGAELDAEKMLQNQVLSRVVGLGLDQIAPAVSDGASAAWDWVRKLGLTPEQLEALQEASAGLEFDAGALANESFADIPLAEYGVQPGMTPMFSRMAESPTDNPFASASRPASTVFGGPGMLSAEVPPDVALQATFPQAAALADGVNALSSELDQPNQQEEAPAQPKQQSAVEKGVRSLLQKAVNEIFQDDPTDAPVQDEGETDAQYQEELLTYLGLDPQAMLDEGLKPGTPEYMARILEQADLRIEELTQGLDLNAEDLSAQLRTKTDEELKALQRALYVRGQLEGRSGGNTAIDPTTGEEISIGDVEGDVDAGLAGYQAGLARDIENVRSVDQLNALLRRGFDPYGMQRAADVRFEEAKRNEREEDELRRRRRGMLGL